MMNNIIKKLRLTLRIVFSRTAVIFLLLFLQAMVFVVTLSNLSEYTTAIHTIFLILEVFVLIHIMNEESNASFKMVWIIPVLVIPVFGTFMYIYVNMQLGTKRMHKRLTAIERQVKPYLLQNEQVMKRLHTCSLGESGLATYLYHANTFPVYSACGAKYYPLGEDKYEDMIQALQSAKKFIFMEYFIITQGHMWDTILAVLQQKAAEGVEVRVMYDGMCSLAHLPYGYYKKLEKMGIQSRPFSQIKPVFTTYQNNRDHRKILVIDGEIAFTGGVNLADEYINEKVRFGHWKDTAIQITGSAVKSYTLMFLKMWHVANKNAFIPPKEIQTYVLDAAQMERIEISAAKRMHMGGYIIPYGDDPYGEERIGKRVYLDIISRAKDYVHIMTPYLILDDEMVSALRYCAKRGVETVIIMPHIPDKVYAYLLARTYYKELLAYGVKIYEYAPGFVHAKVFVSDDVRATVGSINLDFRSLYLHFECGVYVYDNPVVFDVERDYQETLKKCIPITLHDCSNYPKIKRAAGKLLRLLAPLM